MTIPTRITAMKVATYEVNSIVKTMRSAGYAGLITTEMLLEYIERNVDEDINNSNLIYLDENGEGL
jgi:hypothetical protein